MELLKRYSIGELAKLLGVSKKTLVYWSEQGYIPQPHRDNTLNQGRYWTEPEAKEIHHYKQTNYNRI